MEAPENFNEQSKMLWKQISDRRPKARPEDYLLLENLLTLRERLEAVQLDLEENGLCYETQTGFRRPNPLLKIEENLRKQYSKLLMQVGIAFSIF